MSKEFWKDPVPEPGPPDRALTVYAYGVESGKVDVRNPQSRPIAWNSERIRKYPDPAYMSFIYDQTTFLLNPYYFAGSYKVEISATWNNLQHKGRGRIMLFKHESGGIWQDTSLKLNGGSDGSGSSVNFTNSSSAIVSLANTANQWLAFKFELICNGDVGIEVEQISFNVQKLS